MKSVLPKRFIGSGQQDADECMVSIMSCLDEDIKLDSNLFKMSMKLEQI